MDHVEKDRHHISNRRLQLSGVKLQKARENKGYTREEVANYLDRNSANIIAEFEDGKRAISVEDLMCLSFLYEVSCKELGAFYVLRQEIPRLGKDPKTQKDLHT